MTNSGAISYAPTTLIATATVTASAKVSTNCSRLGYPPLACSKSELRVAVNNAVQRQISYARLRQCFGDVVGGLPIGKVQKLLCCHRKGRINLQFLQYISDAQTSRAVLAPIAGKPIIVFHDAYHPFEARFGVEAAGAIAAFDAHKPGASRIAALQDVVAETSARCVFAEPQLNDKVLGFVMEGQGEVRIAGLDRKGIDLYLRPVLYPTMLTALANSMAECLR